MESPDDDIVRFISGYDRFDLQGAYYAMKCLMYAKAVVRRQGGTLKRSYKRGLLDEIAGMADLLMGWEKQARNARGCDKISEIS